MSDEKDFIRAEALRHRQNLTVDPGWADLAAAGFMSHIPLKADAVVSLYYPKDKEMDTLPLAEALWAKGRAVALPLVKKDAHGLDFALWDKQTELLAGPFGIPVPKDPQAVEPDIVVIPLLVFDQRGHRLGYGKGYYDAALKELRHKKPIIAVGWPMPSKPVCLRCQPRSMTSRSTMWSHRSGFLTFGLKLLKP